MVSADNLPFDVLPLIFHYLSSGTDLVSVALVSKSFSGGALPLVYDTINVRMDMAKRLGSVVSPFHTLLQTPFLQPFVHTISIHSIPVVRHRPSAEFLLELCKLLPNLKNLSSFTYTVPTLMALLPPMLPGLVAIENLRELKIMGEHVNNIQAEMLIKAGYGEPVLRTGKGGAEPKQDAGLSKASEGYNWLKSRPNVEVVKSQPEGEDTDLTPRRRSKGLEKLWLKSPSPSIMSKLEKWVEGNKETLKSLGVVEAPALSTGFLRKLITHVPHLTSLTTMQCPDIDHWKVLEMLEHLPELKNLCINVMAHTQPPVPSPTSTSLKHLRCLFLISRSYNTSQKLQTTFLGLLAPFHTTSLESITFEAMDPISLPMSSAATIAQSHGKTLKRINLLRIVLSTEVLVVLSKGCKALGQLCVDFPAELRSPTSSFITALSSSHKLHTLVDGRALKPHHDHGGQDIILTAQDVSNMVMRIPSLRRVINANRCWNVAKGLFGLWICTPSRINPTAPPLSFIRDT